jgi:predicted transcriptional regulator
MTIISSREFAAHQKKYYDMAAGEDVFIKRGRNTFQLVQANVHEDTGGYDEVLEPDDDFRNAITGEEFKKKVLDVVEKVHRMFSDK